MNAEAPIQHTMDCATQALLWHPAMYAEVLRKLLAILDHAARDLDTCDFLHNFAAGVDIREEPTREAMPRAFLYALTCGNMPPLERLDPEDDFDSPEEAIRAEREFLILWQLVWKLGKLTYEEQCRILESLDKPAAAAERLP